VGQDQVYIFKSYIHNELLIHPAHDFLAYISLVFTSVFSQ